MHLKAADRPLDDHGDEAPAASAVLVPISQHRPSTLSNNLYTAAHGIGAAPAKARGSLTAPDPTRTRSGTALYTPEQRLRRDATGWTLVQGILAPVQLLVFVLSAGLVLRYLATGHGLEIATASVVLKTVLLYAIMITGAIWEREVFGVYLFAPAFFWEDVFSFLVLALHTAYLIALFAGFGTPQQQMILALAAYATYVVNATQFVLKLRAARRDERLVSASLSGSAA